MTAITVYLVTIQTRGLLLDALAAFDAEREDLEEEEPTEDNEAAAP